MLMLVVATKEINYCKFFFIARVLIHAVATNLCCHLMDAPSKGYGAKNYRCLWAYGITHKGNCHF